jgi:hypothetical protein
VVVARYGRQTSRLSETVRLIGYVTAVRLELKQNQLVAGIE